MKKPAYFQMYLDNYEALQCLSEAQVGRLVMAVYAYAIKETEPDFTDDPALQVTFAFIRRNIDREFESYSKKCERNQRNVMNRCESTSNVASRNESIPNVTSRNESLEVEKEKEEEKEEEHSLSARVVTQFHEICDELPKVKKLTAKRCDSIQAAQAHLSGTDFADLFRKVACSDFLCGRSGKWRADFDWILRPDNLTRILEGSFDNRGSPQKMVSSYDIGELERINTLEGY